jgi:hypothetical protein
MPKTRFLPMFPLRLVVFPKEKLNLHIFEPRYKQLILECEKNNTTFGTVANIDERLMTFGTEICLKSIVKRYDNGEMDITTEGVGLFKIEDYYAQAVGKMYGAADVIDKKIKYGEIDYIKSEKILELTQELFTYLKINKEIPSNSTDFKCFQIAHYVGYTIEQEYQFLCLPHESARQNYLLKHLENILPIVKEMELLRQKALLNGYFKQVK